MLLPIYAIYLAIASCATFFVYLADKRKAKKDKWRVSEKTLLCMSFFGGAIGGYSAMFFSRHKTRRWYFHAINVIGIVWQVALLIFLIVQSA